MKIKVEIEKNHLNVIFPYITFNGEKCTYAGGYKRTVRFRCPDGKVYTGHVYPLYPWIYHGDRYVHHLKEE